MRVLVVARWYPSYDLPFRGDFVADLVEALGRQDVDQVVASWEAAFVGGPLDRRAVATLRAEAAWSMAVREPEALNTPQAWGSPGVPVARLPVVIDPRRRSPAISIERHAALLVPFAAALHRRWPFDVVHAHVGIPDGLAAAVVADRLELPLVVTEHASNAIDTLLAWPGLQVAYRTLAQGSRRRLLAVSESLAGEIAAAAAIARENVHVMPNAVPVARFPAADPAGRRADELLYVGARSEAKGTDVLLRALARLRAGNPTLRLRLIGPSPGGDERFVRTARELGIADIVSFEPTIDRPGVAAAMARATILVHPSRYETFGMVAAEAIATGLPVAASPSGGVDAIVGPDGRCGEIAAAPDDLALATAVERLLERRERLDPAEMRRSIEERFGADRVAGRVKALYQSLAGSDMASGPGPDVVAVRSRPLADRVVVVGLDRRRLDRRLATLPPEVAQRVRVITTPNQESSRGSPGGAARLDLVEIDADAEYRAALDKVAAPALSWLPARLRRIARVLLNPRRAVRRRRLVAEQAAMRRTAVARGAARSWAEHRGALPDGAIPWLVACDVEDVELAPVVAADGRLAPGGLRWLADALSADTPDAG